MTHPSWGKPHYQRLEFLGDKVLGAAVAELLVERFADADEGELSRRHTALVRESTLVDVAARYEVGPYVRLGPGEPLKPAIMADVVEAILGDIGSKHGPAAVRAVVAEAWAPYLDQKDEKDPKTRLQEIVQGQGHPLPTYNVVTEAGPDHDKTFTVEVRTAMGTATGTAGTKQNAGAAAAAELMNQLEITR